MFLRNLVARSRHTLDQLQDLRHAGRELWRADAFAEMELRSPSDHPDAPNLYYLGRQQLFSESMFLLPDSERIETAVVYARQLSLAGFLQRRRQVENKFARDNLICVIDTLALHPAALPQALRFAPQVRALLPTAAPAVARAQAHRGLQVRTSRAYSDFSKFYDHMLLPLARLRPHGTVAVPSKDRLWRLFTQMGSQRQGCLVLLEQDGAPVCGALVHARKQEPSWLAVAQRGMVRPELLSPPQRQELLARLQEQVVAHAARQNFAFVDLGTVPARPDAAITRQRLQLGCTLQPERDGVSFALHVPHHLAARVLAATPLLIDRAGTLELYNGALRLAEARAL